MTDPLHKAKVEIEADLTGLKEGVVEARQEVESLGEAGEKSGTRLSAGLGRANKSAEKLQSAVSKLLVPVALFIGLKRVVDWFQKAIHAAEEFREELDAVGESGRENLGRALRDAANVDDLGESIIQIRKRAESEVDSIAQTVEQKLSRSGQRLRDLTGLDVTTKQAVKSAEDAIAEVNRVANQEILTLQRTYRNRRLAEARDAAKKEAEAEAEERLSVQERLFEEERSARRRALLAASTEEEAIAREAAMRIADIRRDLFIEGQDQLLQSVTVQRIEDAIKAERDIRLKAVRDRLAEEERLEIEKNARVVKKMADDFKREMDRAAQSLFSSTGTSAGFGGFSGLVDAARDVADAIRGGHGGRR